MNIKRVLSGTILFPIFAIIFVFGDKYVIDVFLSAIALLSIHEFYGAFKEKANPICWVGYLSAVAIAFAHIIPTNYRLLTIGAIIPVSIMVLFADTILNNMKRNIADVAITFFGICYIVIFLLFAGIIRESLENGKIIVWYVFFTAWGTDIFAYIVGKNFGKHKFTEISPNKTIEGCIGGIFGALLMNIVYTIICNQVFHLEISYLYIIGMTIVLSIASQIGDLAASSIKRYCGIKDYSNLIPGHGGMLDRIDSVIFILPFAYFLLMLV